MLLDLTCNHAVAFFETNRWRFDDECLGDLAGLFVRHLDDSTIVNGGVGKEVCFKFCWGDLVALLMVKFILYKINKNDKPTLTLISSLIRSTMKTCSWPDGALRMTASSPVSM
jgi:hypothetical protein